MSNELGEKETRLAKRAGAVTSADEIPVDPRTETTGARVDLQERVFPDSYDVREREYPQPGPVAGLPEKVSQAEIARDNRQFWPTGPADSEADAPLLSGTKVVEKGGRP